MNALKPTEAIRALARRARAWVFDFDGTLVDSNAIKLRGFDVCFASFPEHGERIRTYCYGNRHTPRGEKFRYVYERILQRPYTAEAETHLHKIYEEATTQQVCRAPEIPGAERFLKSAGPQRITAVLSTTPDAVLRTILKARGWEPYFSEIRGAPVHKARWLRNFQKRHALGPEDLLFFGDTAEDAGAAQEAGWRFITVANTALNAPPEGFLNDWMPLDDAG